MVWDDEAREALLDVVERGNARSWRFLLTAGVLGGALARDRTGHAGSGSRPGLRGRQRRVPPAVDRAPAHPRRRRPAGPRGRSAGRRRRHAGRAARAGGHRRRRQPGRGGRSDRDPHRLRRLARSARQGAGRGRRRPALVGRPPALRAHRARRPAPGHPRGDPGTGPGDLRHHGPAPGRPGALGAGSPPPAARPGAGGAGRHRAHGDRRPQPGDPTSPRGRGGGRRRRRSHGPDRGRPTILRHPGHAR